MKVLYLIHTKMTETVSTPKIKPLGKGNYMEWSGEMKAWLMRNKLWRLVSGREAKPSASKVDDLDLWEAKAEQAAGEIYLCVEQSQRVHFRGHEEDPIQMWKLLEAAHVSKKPGARFNAYDDLFSIHKADDESLIDLGVRVENAMANIQNLRPKDMTIDKLDEELEAMALIRALPKSYSHLSMSLLLLDKLDKDVVLQAFRSEELNQAKHMEMANQAKGHFGRSRGGGPSKPRNRPVCYCCQGKGHKISDCPSAPSPNEGCGNCGGKGHRAEDCSSPKRDKNKANTEGANKAAEEKVELVTEFAGKASAALETEAFSTCSNIFHWNTDTGATSHMTPHRNWLRNYTPYRVPIRLADNRVIYSEGIGSVLFQPLINGIPCRNVEFSRVLHVPLLKNNLLAVLYLTRYKEFNVLISKHSMVFKRNKEVLFTASISDTDVGYLDGNTIDCFENVHLASTLPLDLTLWHRRLGHHNYHSIQRMYKDNLVDGLRLDSEAKPDPICEPCLAGKMHANPFLSTEIKSRELLQLVHTDVKHVGITSHSGYLYWVTFIDDFSRFKAVMPMKRKSDTFDCFKQYKAWAENITGKRIQAIQCDGGGEYISNEFNNYLATNGIEPRYTTRNRPQQNGVAERANRILAEGITAMLNESGLSKQFWAEALAAFVHVWNYCPTSAVPGVIPYESWYKRKPSVGHLRVWGCVAYVHVQKDKRLKLGSHMQKCVFIGYPAGYKGWKFYDPSTRKVIICERADFDERYNFSGALLRGPENINDKQEPTFLPLEPLVPFETSPTSNKQNIEPPAVPEEQPASVDIEQPVLNDNNQDLNPLVDVEEEDDDGPIVIRRPRRRVGIPIDSDDEVDNRPIAIRKQQRTTQPPGEWWKVRNPPPAVPLESESESEMEEVNQVKVDEPSWHEAMNGPYKEKWREACQEEMKSLLENGTWDIVELPPDQKAIGSRWIFRVKRNSDGSIERFKARLVAKGYNQWPGFDYEETFASTMRYASLRTVLALSALEGLHLRSIDISSAFLNGDIDCDIYMKQPDGFKQGGSNMVCKLNKSLYGLKQSPRLWGEKFSSVMKTIGFKRLSSDPSLYIYNRDDIKVIVPVFVDDITLASKSEKAVDRFVSELATHFKLRDLGPTSYLLGIKIDRDFENKQIFLSQKQYIINKLEEFGMSNCKPLSTPLVPGIKLSKEQCPKTPEEEADMRNIPYINAVGSLLYLATMTRPDIAFAAGVLARFNANPGKAHWAAVKHVFRYLKGTMDLRLVYGPNPDQDDLFVTFSDADHGGDKDSGKSTTGWIVRFGLGVVDWMSKRQSVVTLSTTEAELVAGVAAGKEICWIQNLLLELGYKSPAPALLYTDNQSALQVAKNPEHHGRMKHLDLAHYWLRDHVGMGEIMPMHISTEDMVADLLTKSLPRQKVEKFRRLMGLV